MCWTLGDRQNLRSLSRKETNTWMKKTLQALNFYHWMFEASGTSLDNKKFSRSVKSKKPIMCAFRRLGLATPSHCQGCTPFRLRPIPTEACSLPRKEGGNNEGSRLWEMPSPGVQYWFTKPPFTSSTAILSQRDAIKFAKHFIGLSTWSSLLSRKIRKQDDSLWRLQLLVEGNLSVHANNGPLPGSLSFYTHTQRW